LAPASKKLRSRSCPPLRARRKDWRCTPTRRKCSRSDALRHAPGSEAAAPRAQGDARSCLAQATAVAAGAVVVDVVSGNAFRSPAADAAADAAANAAAGGALESRSLALGSPCLAEVARPPPPLLPPPLPPVPVPALVAAVALVAAWSAGLVAE